MSDGIAVISGQVNDRLEPVITLQLRGPDGEDVSIEAVIDTGYNGDLSLPQFFVEGLHAPRLADRELRLADGVLQSFPVYLADVLWDGVIIQLFASALGDVPLIGTSLLSGHELRIEVRVGGEVRLIELNR